MMSQATCIFCALTDDTIQVICESRCLICSRCQQIPTLRKLLIEHTMAIDVSSTATQPARTYLKGFCPVCESAMSTTMLTLISTYKELYKAGGDDITSVCTKFNSFSVLETLILLLRILGTSKHRDGTGRIFNTHSIFYKEI